MEKKNLISENKKCNCFLFETYSFLIVRVLNTIYYIGNLEQNA